MKTRWMIAFSLLFLAAAYFSWYNGERERRTRAAIQAVKARAETWNDAYVFDTNVMSFHQDTNEGVIPIRKDDNLYIDTNASPYYLFEMRVDDKQTILTIATEEGSIVTVHRDGTVLVSPGLSEHEAAVRFWRILGATWTNLCDACSSNKGILMHSDF